MCDKCLNSANHEMCVVNILSSVNATPTVKRVLNKGKQIWKPKGKLSDNRLNKTKRVWKATGKLFADIGYQWRPTGKKFTLGKLMWLSSRTGHPLVYGLLAPPTQPPVKHYAGNRSTAHEFVGNGSSGQSDSGMITSEPSWVMEIMLLVTVRSTNLYTISIDEMMKSSPICLLSKASKSKSWLWHRRLNHLNFGTINDLARKDLVRGLPRLKFEKDHLCSDYTVGLLNNNSQIIRTDNGTEFVNQVMSEYYKGVGIFHQNSVPRIPQQNGIVERQNRTLVEAALFGVCAILQNDSDDLENSAKLTLGFSLGMIPRGGL
ncbi:integrase, catalytic region, zinc finger, CCHC-type containing protein [Tanacetum coccineum]